MRTFRVVLFSAALLASCSAWSIDPVQFDDPAQMKRFKALVEEFRCLQCQNQTLSDSAAPLAQDLRREIADMIRADRSDDEIRGFLVQRYGDFVLYRPPVKPSTWFLWFGPFMLFLVSAVTVFIIVKRRAQAVEIPLSEPERAAADRLVRDRDS